MKGALLAAYSKQQNAWEFLLSVAKEGEKSPVSVVAEAAERYAKATRGFVANFRRVQQAAAQYNQIFGILENNTDFAFGQTEEGRGAWASKWSLIWSHIPEESADTMSQVKKYSFQSLLGILEKMRAEQHEKKKERDRRQFNDIL